MKKLINFLLFFLVSCICAGCGSFSSDSPYGKESYYADSKKDLTENLVENRDAEGQIDAEQTVEDQEAEEQKTKETEQTGKTDESISDEHFSEETLVVYICGAVAVPGVYELPADARVVQAIEAAGGLREDADTVLINQAKRLVDGEQIRILTQDEAREAEASGNAQDGISVEGDSISGETNKVNINLADMTALMTLPGIGQAKAEAIIEYRKSNGRFTSIDEIMNISGIKESVFSKIKDKITV